MIAPTIIQATFADLEEDDEVDVFGLFRDDGSIDADKVLIFRGPDQEEPTVIGVVVGDLASVDADADGILDLLVGAEDGLIYYFHRAFLDDDLPNVDILSRKEYGVRQRSQGE